MEKIKRKVVIDMTKEFIALVKIEFYNEEKDLETDNIIITNVKNFTEAVMRLESYYSNNLYKIIELTLYDGPFLKSDSVSFDLIKEDFSR